MLKIQTRPVFHFDYKNQKQQSDKADANECFNNEMKMVNTLEMNRVN